jgi:phosphatidylglycerol:prolipoprotein diacylglycerol transferase
MHPIAFSLGPLTVRWYGVMAAAGFLMAVMFIQFNRKEAKLTSDQASNMIFIAMVSGVLGSRIFYVIQFWEQFRDNWVDIIRIDKGGLVFYGGFILALISLYTYCRKIKVDFLKVFDIMTPAMTIGHACGRIGCFLNGCCFGTITNSSFGVKYPVYSEPYMRYPDAALHPVQLYEAAFNFVMCGVMLYLVRKVRYKGLPMGIYFIAYGLMRFIFEFFRGDNAKMAGFTIAQYIGIGLIAAGAVITIFSFKHRELPAEEENV